MSLTARARHFQPMESGGCFCLRKWVPSRNQSQVRMSSCRDFGRKRAASSPIPRESEGQPGDRDNLAILDRIESSVWRIFGMSCGGHPRPVRRGHSSSLCYNRLCHPPDRTEAFTAPRLTSCPFGQGAGLHSLSQKVLKTGLTSNSTKSSMATVATQGSQQSRASVEFRPANGHQGNSPANTTFSI